MYYSHHPVVEYFPITTWLGVFKSPYFHSVIHNTVISFIYKVDKADAHYGSEEQTHLYCKLCYNIKYKCQRIKLFNFPIIWFRFPKHTSSKQRDVLYAGLKIKVIYLTISISFIYDYKADMQRRMKSEKKAELGMCKSATMLRSYTEKHSLLHPPFHLTQWTSMSGCDLLKKIQRFLTEWTNPE